MHSSHPKASAAAFARSERGSVAIIFALAATTLIVTVGVAIAVPRRRPDKQRREESDGDADRRRADNGNALRRLQQDAEPGDAL
jgi:hypothetical protein